MYIIIIIVIIRKCFNIRSFRCADLVFEFKNTETLQMLFVFFFFPMP